MDPDQESDGFGYSNGLGALPPDVQLSQVLFPSSGHLAGSQTVGAHNVDAVLSASHYPVPHAVRIRNLFSDSHGSELSVNEFLDVLQKEHGLESDPQQLNLDTTLPSPDGHGQSSSQSDERAKTLPKQPRKQPGRPRLPPKAAGVEGNTSERRRKQLREAQRGYRMRKESRISDLVHRVTQLESSMDNIVSGVVSVTEQITRSGALASHPDLSRQLSDVLQTCLVSIKENMNSDDEDHDTAGMLSPPVPFPLPSPVKTHLPASLPIPTPIPYSTRHAILTPPNSRGNAVMLPDFINNLIFSIVYYGYTMLADPATPWDHLTRHFQLCLTTIGRERMTLYFSAAFDAKVRRQKHLQGWSEMPFFSLGGAGTHYSTALEDKENSKELPMKARYPAKVGTYQTIPATAGAFPSAMYDEVEGDWFDMADLQLFLQEKAPDLRTAFQTAGDLPAGFTDATIFARGLVKKSTCLGRSAGFRRKDVEAALQAATFG